MPRARIRVFLLIHDGSPNLKQMIMTEQEIKQTAGELADKVIFTTKEVLTSDEAARYMGISKSYLYKLTMRREIPHYKPMGKVCYFNRKELEGFLQGNRISTAAEISSKAQSHCMNDKAAR